MDIALVTVQDPASGLRSLDFQLDGPDLLADEGLQTSIALSLFCNREAAPDDALPFGTDDPAGWWADRYLAESAKQLSSNDKTGSRLWLLEGAPANQATATLAAGYAREALQWLVDQKIASSITIRTQWVGRNELALVVTIAQKDARGVATILEFEFLWSPIPSVTAATSGIYSDGGTILETEDGSALGTEDGSPLGME